MNSSAVQCSAKYFTVFPKVRFQVQTHIYQWSRCIIYKIVSGLLHKQLGPHSLNVLNGRKIEKLCPWPSLPDGKYVRKWFRLQISR